MKKLILAVFMAAFCVIVSAQQLYNQDKGNLSMLMVDNTIKRTEIILPEVNGFKVVKVDLHVHTCYSDGYVTPQYRVIEGWQNGLDAIAVTDHIEYLPNLKKMKKLLGNMIVDKDDKTLSPDFNVAVLESESQAKSMGITIIPGVEITRNPVDVGHFNALFTIDNNLIPAEDPLQSIRNAKQQGAIVQNNHPGWRRKDNSFTSVMQAALNEGLIDGVEVFNADEFYPDVIEEGLSRGLFLSSNTDIHDPFQDKSGSFQIYRNMTLVLANDASLSSIREGLENRRTLAYARGEIAGPEDLLRDFFKASVMVEVIQVDNGVKQVKITNNTSITYIIDIPTITVPSTLKSFTSIICKVKEDSLPITVCNMWTGADKHPSFNFDLK